MRNGLSAGPLPAHLPYGDAIQKACEGARYAGLTSFSPLVAYACAVNETIQGEVNGSWSAATVVSADGGHGLFQLTSSFPVNWRDPYTNALFACEHFFMPAEAFWSSPPYSLSGTALLRAIAASFNAGLGNALAGHRRGDVDAYTTAHYADRARAHYDALLAGKSPLVLG
jgi:hypothetical protein